MIAFDDWHGYYRPVYTPSEYTRSSSLRMRRRRPAINISRRCRVIVLLRPSAILRGTLVENSHSHTVTAFTDVEVMLVAGARFRVKVSFLLLPGQCQSRLSVMVRPSVSRGPSDTKSV